MIKSAQDFIGFKVGDIITLSDLQTQAEYNKLSVDFPIKDVRSYSEPNGVFIHYGYIVEAPNHDQYLVLVKTAKEMFEAYIFFKDVGGSGIVFQGDPGKGECPLLPLFNAEGTDFISRIEAQVTDQSGTHPVTWDKQVSSYGISFKSVTEGDGMCSLAEYFTNDENGGNNHCLLDWRGDTSNGYIETWYGCSIKNSEIEFFHK